MDCAKFFERFGGEFVLLVEVRGDYEMAIIVEALEGLVENFVPDGGIIPIVLVPEKGDVRGSDFGEVSEAVATVSDEIGGGLFTEFIFPARIGFSDFSSSNVEALKVGRLRFFAEELGQDLRFIASAAGEVEQAEVVFLIQVRIQELAKVRFQRFEVLLEKVMKGSVGHRRDSNLQSVI